MGVDVTELRLLAHDLGAQAGHIGSKAATVIRKGGADTERDMKILVPKDTTNLEQSISTDIIGSGAAGEMGFETGPTAEYGPDVEYGTQPHVILPKNGQFLVFNVGGKKVFVRKVNHPGTRAQPYAGPAFDRNLPNIIDALGDEGSGFL